MTSNQLTYGGAAATLVILAVVLFLWWRDGKKMARLVPLTGHMAVGAMLAACTDGLFGWIGGLAASGTNTAGRVAAGGTGSLEGSVATAATRELTPGAAILVVIFVGIAVAALALAHKSKDWVKVLKSLLMIVAGASLAITAGGADWLDGNLYDWLNSLGQPIDNWLNGAS
ncbi:hypothetical protein [Streptomyces xiamenensis]|uniref:hypothetical protein n=1 Tax=Streptomyces xiamenensis TaxID=408015 RepID=UPI003D715CBE